MNMEAELTELLALVRESRAECDYNSTGSRTDAAEARATSGEAEEAEEAFISRWGTMAVQARRMEGLGYGLRGRGASSA